MLSHLGPRLEPFSLCQGPPGSKALGHQGVLCTRQCLSPRGYPNDVYQIEYSNFASKSLIRVVSLKFFEHLAEAPDWKQKRKYEGSRELDMMAKRKEDFTQRGHNPWESPILVHHLY